MRGRRIITWFITAAVIALPLLLCSVAQAESGCHSNEGTGTGGTVAARGNSTNG